jgi:hypothetical protein
MTLPMHSARVDSVVSGLVEGQADALVDPVLIHLVPVAAGRPVFARDVRALRDGIVDLVVSDVVIVQVIPSPGVSS